MHQRCKYCFRLALAVCTASIGWMTAPAAQGAQSRADEDTKARKERSAKPEKNWAERPSVTPGTSGAVPESSPPRSASATQGKSNWYERKGSSAQPSTDSNWYQRSDRPAARTQTVSAPETTRTTEDNGKAPSETTPARSSRTGARLSTSGTVRTRASASTETPHRVMQRSETRSRRLLDRR